MAIPDYQSIMLPLLQFLADGKEHSIREAIDHISNHFNLSEEEQQELLSSGQQPIIDNRVGWARTYMKKAGLVESPRRGYAKISPKGNQVLQQKPEKIDVKFLEQFDEFIEFRTVKKELTPKSDETPDELMEKGNELINASLAQELLIKLRSSNPYFFEKIVGKLLQAMGYGKYQVTKRSGDGGIDGIVDQDKLGLDRIFFQAKRYAESNPVSAHDVRDFVGTLDLNGVQKGIFITTSRFPKDSTTILAKTPKNIILVDGAQLAQLMIEYDIGVSTEKAYRIKKIDSDFFVED